jgi:hypothetical protein
MVFAILLNAQNTLHPLLIDSTRITSTTAPFLLRTDRPPALDLLHMPSPYSYQCLGIFCKAEVQMDRWLPIPLMIRIGDVESAEELDGKGAYTARRIDPGP